MRHFLATLIQFFQHFPFAELNSNNLKTISLLTLTVQNSAVSLCMRAAKTRDGDIFLSSTGKAIIQISKTEAADENILILAVFCAEVVKLITCLGLVLLEEGTFLRLKASLHNAIVKNKTDTVS